MTNSKPLSQIIAEAIRGEHEGWPLDPAFPKEPSHKKAFFSKKPDGQRVLWQIHDSIRAGKPIPKWAATAFCKLLVKVVTCNSTWNEAFGEIPAKGTRRREFYRSTLRDLEKNLIKVGEAVISDGGAIDDEMWHRLSKKLGMGSKRLKRCWGFYRSAHNRSTGFSAK
jgi:hypothetical protein